MAVDTRNRRASCLSLALPFGRVFPLPDGSLATVPDRQQLSYLYRLEADATDTVQPFHVDRWPVTIGANVRLRTLRPEYRLGPVCIQALDRSGSIAVEAFREAARTLTELAAPIVAPVEPPASTVQPEPAELPIIAVGAHVVLESLRLTWRLGQAVAQRPGGARLTQLRMSGGAAHIDLAALRRREDDWLIHGEEDELLP